VYMLRSVKETTSVQPDTRLNKDTFGKS